MIVVRDRKIRTTLRTNQIVGFVTVPAWKNININTEYNKYAKFCKDKVSQERVTMLLLAHTFWYIPLDNLKDNLQKFCESGLPW